MWYSSSACWPCPALMKDVCGIDPRSSVVVCVTQAYMLSTSSVMSGVGLQV